MKTLLAIIVAFLFVSIFANAQKTRVALTENSIVKTEDGTVLPTEIWRALMLKGHYALKQDNATQGEKQFIIYALSDSAYEAKMAKSPKPKESEFFKIGENFSMNERDINGNRIKSKDLKGTIFVINFWFINCPPCRAEIPELNKIVETFKDSANIKFIAVALDNRDALTTFLQSTPFNYQIIENGRYLADSHNIHTFPTHVIVDADGKVYFHTTGLSQQTTYWIKKSIQQLLAKGKTGA
jgi:thiol-disulfide isomerase/thioredoxin